MEIDLEQSRTIKPIRNGFDRTGLWDFEELGPSNSKLQSYIQTIGSTNNGTVLDLRQVLTSYDSQARTILVNSQSGPLSETNY